MLDFLIVGGHVLDPSTGADGPGVVGVKDSLIVEAKPDTPASNVVDASGCYVTAGLIDTHTHVFYGGAGGSIHPDLFASTGVTSMVDGGSAGWSNYEAFHNTMVSRSRLRIKGLVGYNSSGQVELGYCEDYRRKTINVNRIRTLLEMYPKEILGLKLRLQREVVGEDGLHFLEEMLAVAEELDCPVVVHTTDPPAPAEDIASLLRPGDVYCHCFQGKGHTIVDERGRVYPAVRRARERGVLFDAANGTGNFAFAPAKAALAYGFYPDLIGADNATISYGLDYYARNLPFVLSKYLALGMTLQQVIKCATQNAARYIGEPQQGTLLPGTAADIAVMRVINKETRFWDSSKSAENEVVGYQMLVPLMTMLDGSVLYRANDM